MHGNKTRKYYFLILENYLLAVILFVGGVGLWKILLFCFYNYTAHIFTVDIIFFMYLALGEGRNPLFLCKILSLRD